MAAVHTTIRPSPAPLSPTVTTTTTTANNAEPGVTHPPLTPSQISTIKSTVPLLAQHALAITTAFYADMLRAEPRMRDVFNSGNMASGRQPAALAAALCAYASHIDHVAALAPAVELIAQRHASLGIGRDDYAVVARYLLAAMRRVLGADVLTTDVADAWAAAYWQLADVFIAREAALYAAQRAAGWPAQSGQSGGGWRRFRIARKERESEAITSFYLEPDEEEAASPGDEGGARKQLLPPFLPGQYVSIRTPVPALGEGRVQARQYSLSDAPNAAYYRVSIKRDGAVSRAMHDERRVGDVVEVSHPQGEFFFDAAAASSSGDDGDDAPVVLISAGVGMTSVTSILNALMKEDTTSSSSSSTSPPPPPPKRRPVTYIHCAHRTALRAFRPHIRALAHSSNNNSTTLRIALFNTHVDNDDGGDDVLGDDYHFAGRLDLGKLDAERDLHLGDARAQYYVCGPVGFMGDAEAWLRARGVAATRVHSEVFGPAGAVGRS